MPHTNTWKPSGLIRTFTGQLDVDELLKSNFELHDDPAFKKINYIINDFSEATNCLIETKHTKVIALTDDIISNSKGNLKIAIVAKDEAHIALANNYKNEMKNQVFKCEVFTTIDEAQNWAEL